MERLPKLIHVATGKASRLTGPLSKEGWKSLMDAADRQGVLEFLFKGVERLPEDQLPPEGILQEWQMRAQSGAIIHETIREQCAELTGIFKDLGHRCCVIKGEAFADYYPDPASRHSGDIDLWVEGDDRQTLKALEDAGYSHTDPLYQECEVKFFRSTNVDVHFRPQKMYNPFANARLQKFYVSCREECMANLNGEGFCVPTLRFNLTHCLVHIFRHLIGETVSLHQLADCNFLLEKASPELRAEVFSFLKKLGLGRFCANVMYALGKLFLTDTSLMLCPASGEAGGERFLGSVRGKAVGEQISSLERTIRHLSLLPEYPWELLWAPAARLWHILWRKSIKKDKSK